MCLPVMCGSPFVQSKQRGFHCRSQRPELWLPHKAGHAEAPGRKHAGERRHPTKPPCYYRFSRRSALTVAQSISHSWSASVSKMFHSNQFRCFELSLRNVPEVRSCQDLGILKKNKQKKCTKCVQILLMT